MNTGKQKSVKSAHLTNRGMNLYTKQQKNRPVCCIFTIKFICFVHLEQALGHLSQNKFLIFVDISKNPAIIESAGKKYLPHIRNEK